MRTARHRTASGATGVLRMLVATAALAAANTVGAAGCSVAASSLLFGPYDTLSFVPVDSVGTVTVSCSGNPGEAVSYRIGVSAGGSGSSSARRLRGPGAWALDYNLFTNGARTLVWGDGAAGSLAVTDTLSLTGGAQQRSHPVYGRIFPRQNVAPGAYTDTLVVTLEF
jgi:spore coat protein U-like protein